MKQITIIKNKRIISTDICECKKSTLHKLNCLLSIYNNSKLEIDIFIDNVKFNKDGFLETFATPEKNNLILNVDFSKVDANTVLHFFDINMKQ
jgi:hypothetical protein